MSETNRRQAKGDPARAVQDDVWTPCQGEILGLSRKLKGQRTRRRALATVVAAALAAGAMFSFGRLGSEPSFTPEVLACGEVKSYQLDYAAGRLDGNLRRNIERHLDHCPQCRRYYENAGGRQRATNGRSSLSAVL